MFVSSNELLLVENKKELKGKKVKGTKVDQTGKKKSNTVEKETQSCIPLEHRSVTAGEHNVVQSSCFLLKQFKMQYVIIFSLSL